MDHVNCIVAGAGVIGIATARALALAGRDVVIIEAEDIIGSHTSSRNSEVIHAGIYYAENSLKASFCVSGKMALYDYCRDRAIPHEQTGKLIVATRNEDLDTLASIHRHALANGVDDIRQISAEEAVESEPELSCIAALHSPSTGIVDSHALILSMLGEAEDRGTMVAFGTKVASVRPDGRRFIVAFEGDDADAVSCDIFINAAGHGAWDIARSIPRLPAGIVPPHLLSKGNYYSLSGHPCPFRQLIYPVPGDGSLGIHFTRDLAGQARFGPDVFWMDGEELDYTVLDDRADDFAEAIRTYWPALPDNALAPSYCGIRPKMVGSGQPAADFVIRSPKQNGFNGLVQLFGMESPGLTGCLVIGEYVADMALKDFR
ncbi:NAD(P)/FAD-dependent oxidoreductase [Hoeflea prorocentri]|uniref:NAD(P)/FAD-dependent oxidoreductase n=1 Tax=Hoeflea prorocentri TaxID=1922333 RepID=A0A9X3UJ53_9HYPH|nr:NAD(P)/FAD-dependent oxidoreductase [Hoeflea prorocentri]MCY6381624.1 NAD(P)/FAD-dependent oxidoreductase [Hoeflea prorocentri]MDA5399424.1 NAD(P)/FAD-dependent oxidoreductase [Hoeflea prorocentri]